MNMSYCRMHNTSADLLDCLENIDNVKSKSEARYRERIIRTALEIVEMCTIEGEINPEYLKENFTEEEE